MVKVKVAPTSREQVVKPSFIVAHIVVADGVLQIMVKFALEGVGVDVLARFVGVAQNPHPLLITFHLRVVIGA